jgi:hypothetical protein
MVLRAVVKRESGAGEEITVAPSLSEGQIVLEVIKNKHKSYEDLGEGQNSE